MKAGSAADSQFIGQSSNTTFVLDMTQPSATWRQTPSMAYARSFLNLTTLPDGSVLATGGETDKDGGKIANAVYAAELWSSQSQTWSTMASMSTPREYHGTALLCRTDAFWFPAWALISVTSPTRKARSSFRLLISLRVPGRA